MGYWWTSSGHHKLWSELTKCFRFIWRQKAPGASPFCYSSRIKMIWFNFFPDPFLVAHNQGVDCFSGWIQPHLFLTGIENISSPTFSRLGHKVYKCHPSPLIKKNNPGSVWFIHFNSFRRILTIFLTANLLGALLKEQFWRVWSFLASCFSNVFYVKKVESQRKFFTSGNHSSMKTHLKNNYFKFSQSYIITRSC